MLRVFPRTVALLFLVVSVSGRQDEEIPSTSFICVDPDGLLQSRWTIYDTKQ